MPFYYMKTCLKFRNGFIRIARHNKRNLKNINQEEFSRHFLTGSIRHFSAFLQKYYYYMIFVRYLHSGNLKPTYVIVVYHRLVRQDIYIANALSFSLFNVCRVLLVKNATINCETIYLNITI